MTISVSHFERISAARNHVHIPLGVYRFDEDIPIVCVDDIPTYRIVIISDGEGMLVVDEQPHGMGRGSVFLVDASIPLDIETKNLVSLRGICLTYRSMSTDGSTPTGLEYPAALHGFPADILRIASELEQCWRAPQLGGPFRVQQLFIDLLLGIYREIESRQEDRGSWMEQALHYIEANYDTDLTREQLAGMANVSPEHFSRAFRKHTGRTFNAYLSLLRIRSAQTRMLIGSEDLHTVAQEVGYKEGLYLSRKFKEWVGMSPTLYQRKPKRIAALNENYTAMLMALDAVPALGVYTPWLEQACRMQGKPIGAKFNPYDHAPNSYYGAIAAHGPDLIIGYHPAKENQRLLPIAPLVEIPFMTMNWREQFRLIAGMIQRESVAENWLFQYNQLVDECNGRLDQEVGKRGTAIVWEICQRSAYCFSSSFGRGSQILYEDLGFQLPPQLLAQNIAMHGYLEAAIESIADYPADYIFITSLPSLPEGQQHANRFFRSPKWLQLDAVRHKRVYLLNQPELFYGFDPISTYAQLHELMHALTKDHKYA
ncbi:ABC transporter substrate-binding protein [Paenibacillus guangzhouensis]|uniref:ABC transporter substrate-binding protein n=1 Tax=Paenibacillus guangzhouensis TaxID=1473112 RepID=UPI001266F751|nr:ABC transporter substrate-binding protein [Paenibacillus guangzhouensis]